MSAPRRLSELSTRIAPGMSCESLTLKVTMRSCRAPLVAGLATAYDPEKLGVAGFNRFVVGVQPPRRVARTSGTR
jgi:hypothetical protein